VRHDFQSKGVEEMGGLRGTKTMYQDPEIGKVKVGEVGRHHCPWCSTWRKRTKGEFGNMQWNQFQWDSSLRTSLTHERCRINSGTYAVRNQGKGRAFLNVEGDMKQ